MTRRWPRVGVRQPRPTPAPTAPSSVPTAPEVWDSASCSGPAPRAVTTGLLRASILEDVASSHSTVPEGPHRLPSPRGPADHLAGAGWGALSPLKPVLPPGSCTGGLRAQPQRPASVGDRRAGGWELLLALAQHLPLLPTPPAQGAPSSPAASFQGPTGLFRLTDGRSGFPCQWAEPVRLVSWLTSLQPRWGGCVGC